MKCHYPHFHLYTSERSMYFWIVSTYCVYTSSIKLKSVLSTSLVHQSGAAGHKVRRRWSKHKSERGNAKIESTLRNVQPFSIDVKGEGKVGNRRKGLLKEARQRKTWRKHWIIGGCVAINANGGDCWKCCH